MSNNQERRSGFVREDKKEIEESMDVFRSSAQTIFGDHYLRSINDGLFSHPAVVERYAELAMEKLDGSFMEEDFANNLLPRKLTERLLNNPVFSHFSRDVDDFKFDFIESLESHELSLDVWMEFLKVRGEYIAKEVLPEAQEACDRFVEQYAGEFLRFIVMNIDASEEQEALLQNRLEIMKVKMVDPLLGTLNEWVGIHDGDVKEIAVVASSNFKKTVIHELCHAISAHAISYDREFYATSDLGTDEEDSVGDIMPPAFINKRTGARISDRFSFLNEAVTETLTQEFVDENPKIFGSSTGIDALLKAIMRDDHLSGVYISERRLLGVLFDISASDNLTEEQKTKVEIARNKAEKAGITVDVFDLRDLLYKAYFFDHVKDEDGKGRAEYWRQWSSKMRDLYGDGILVRLDKTWNEHANQKSGQGNQKTVDACVRLLYESVIAKWG